MATYATAIAIAIESKDPQLGLTTKQLCSLLEPHKTEVPIMVRSQNWRNGVRHTLSGNEGFYHKKNQSCLMPWRYVVEKLPKSTQSTLRKFQKLRQTEPDTDMVRWIV